MRKAIMALALVAISTPAAGSPLDDWSQFQRDLEADRIESEREAQEYRNQLQHLWLEEDMRELRLEQDRLRYELELQRQMQPW